MNGEALDQFVQSRVGSRSSLLVLYLQQDSYIVQANSEYPDQASRMNRLVWIFRCSITKTRLYNFDPLKPHFYIVKLGFTGVDIIFLILLKT